MAEESGSKKKLIIIIAAALIILSIVGAGAFFIFSGDDSADSSEEVSDSRGMNQTAPGTNYVPMPRPLVFNVMDAKRERTVQIKVQLMVTSARNEELARKHVPLLESTLLRVFGAASAKQLRSPEGKSELRKTALHELNEAAIKLEGHAIVHTVLFTGFVLQ